MAGWRIPNKGVIDQEKPLNFSLDGKTFQGFQGDSIASALLASDQKIVGRGFKYHRPRGLWGMGYEEPNGIFDIHCNGQTTPNARATTNFIQDGMELKSINTWPSLNYDFLKIFSYGKKFLPAGFYYKTFIYPNWMFWEPLIRNLAGLGSLNEHFIDFPRSYSQYSECPLIVVGAGPAGLAAAEAAADEGTPLWLIESENTLGGSLRWRQEHPQEPNLNDYYNRVCRKIRDVGGKVLINCMIWGAFDHGLYAAWEKKPTDGNIHWKIRPERVILATGAIERPIWFPNNDLPGVMSAEAAFCYVQHYGVAPGKNILIATGNDAPYPLAILLKEIGCNVSLIDARQDPNLAPDPDVDFYTGEIPIFANGRPCLSNVHTNNHQFEVDTLLVSGGFTPTIHLFMHNNGKIRWDEHTDSFLPTDQTKKLSVIGAANGNYEINSILQEAITAGGGKPSGDLEHIKKSQNKIFPFRPVSDNPKLTWIDFQNDVTLSDINLVYDEGYTEIEHLKRYTTLGMAIDQGKTSNLGGIFSIANLTGLSPTQTGITTFRPPFNPIPLRLIAGQRANDCFNPLKRLQLEQLHRENGAKFREYGGWLRPAVYRSGDEQSATQLEARISRETVGLFDASPLGKIEVIGPKASNLLDFCFYSKVSSMKTGRARYNLILNEKGIVFDDSILIKIQDDRFIVSASSSHVDGVKLLLEEVRQDRKLGNSVFIHDTTSNWNILTVLGPLSQMVLMDTGLVNESELDVLTHMSFIEGYYDGLPIRITRVSFTGEKSYEVSLHPDLAEGVFKLLLNRVDTVGGTLLGIESSMILRAEKGYIIVGKDTDGMTMPQDLGWDRPRQHRKDEFLGNRSLHSEEANRNDRRCFIGLKFDPNESVPKTGSHLIPLEGEKRSLGFITSSYYSPSLKVPIALGLLEGGFAQFGKKIKIFNHNQIRMAEVCSPCFFDPQGERIHG